MFNPLHILKGIGSGIARMGGNTIAVVLPFLFLSFAPHNLHGAERLDSSSAWPSSPTQEKLREFGEWGIETLEQINHELLPPDSSLYAENAEYSSSITDGTIEFDYRYLGSSTSDYHQVIFYDESVTTSEIIMMLVGDTDGILKFVSGDGSDGKVKNNLFPLIANTDYHITIDFDTASGTFDAVAVQAPSGTPVTVTHNGLLNRGTGFDALRGMRCRTGAERAHFQIDNILITDDAPTTGDVIVMDEDFEHADYVVGNALPATAHGIDWSVTTSGNGTITIESSAITEGGSKALELNDTVLTSGSPIEVLTTSMLSSYSGGITKSQVAYNWSSNIQFRVLNSAAILHPELYAESVRRYSSEMHQRYWLSIGGYSCVADQTGERFWDDNGGMLISLMEAYEILGDNVLLERARATFSFMLEGEDDVCGGGIYQRENKKEKKVCTSTVQAVIGALMLYKATGEHEYIAHAERLYRWLYEYLLDENDGLFSMRIWVATGEVTTTKMEHNTGYPMLANCLFFDVTKEERYLIEAQRIAHKAAERFIKPDGSFTGSGKWTFKLSDAFVDLYERDHNPAWLSLVDRGLTHVHDIVRDANGHYPEKWSEPASEPLEQWKLIDQAAAARAYLRLSTAVEKSRVQHHWNTY